MEELIIKVNGSFPLKFQWGWICGNEEKGGLGIEVGELCPYNTPKNKLKFRGGGVIERKDARELVELITKGLANEK